MTMTDEATAGGQAAQQDEVLDNPAWSALSGPHQDFAIGDDLVRHYPEDISPFTGVRDWDDPAVWDTLTEMFGHGVDVSISHADPVLPDGWEHTHRVPGVQLVETPQLHTRFDEEAVELTLEDADEVLAFIDRTRPGPFRPRTLAMGRYVGFRRDGALIAMAGERLHAAGWVEISAVAVDEAYRRQGLASRLVLDVAHHVRSRGDRAFMHASAENTGAIAGYEKLGFTLRKQLTFQGIRVP
jgi:ribosomal protein S18 acetylase RimI-like enzyme